MEQSNFTLSWKKKKKKKRDMLQFSCHELAGSTEVLCLKSSLFILSFSFLFTVSLFCKCQNDFSCKGDARKLGRGHEKITSEKEEKKGFSNPHLGFNVSQGSLLKWTRLVVSCFTVY